MERVLTGCTRLLVATVKMAVFDICDYRVLRAITYHLGEVTTGNNACYCVRANSGTGYFYLLRGAVHVLTSSLWNLLEKVPRYARNEIKR